MPDYIIGILSYSKNLQNAIKQRDKYFNFDKSIKVLIFVGDETLETDFVSTNEIVYLRCKDDWVNIPHKVYLFYKYVYENYPDIKGVVKMDDNINVDSTLLNQVILNIKEDQDFVGRVFNFGAPYSDYIRFMQKKELYNQYPELEKYRFWVGYTGVSYCSGNCYYISKKSLQVVVNNSDLFLPYPDDISKYLARNDNNEILNTFNIFEDKNVGKALERKQIFPIHSEDLFKSLRL